MSRGLKASLFALCLASAVSACDWGGDGQTTGAASPQSTTSSAHEPEVESSLEGMAELPSRIHWSATTSLSPERVDKVQFLVDGDRWWEDSTPPYTYGPPGAYLAARWISSLRLPPNFHKHRMHEFVVRVKATSGKKWESTPVRARTPEATVGRPPGGFVGPFPTQEYVRRNGFLHFIGSSIFVGGGKHNAAWAISGDVDRVRFGTPIFLRGSHADAGSGFTDIERVLCTPDGPPATYTWSQTTGKAIADFSETTSFLELRVIKDSCGARRRLLAGVWEGIHAD